MTQILHTADVHLDTDAPERRAALSAVLDAADEADVDAVTIGGDCFDSAEAADALRSDLRTLFADRDYPVIAIPGNHDVDAFEVDLFFGEAFTAAVAEPFGHHAVGDARLTTLPYTPELDDETLLALADREPFDGPECLLLHCSLEAPVDATAGDEGGVRYCPVTRAELDELGFDYYLAGHFHSSHELDLAGGGRFVYPGSPASVTRAEQGPRSAVLLDLDGPREGRLERRRLATYHCDELALTVAPGEEDEVVDRVADRVATWRDRDVDAAITVEGFVEWDESTFDAALSDAAGDVPCENRTRTLAHLRTHPLFAEVRSELDAREEPRSDSLEGEIEDPVAFTSDVEDELLAAFSRLQASGDL